jgi:hypothetical protein
MSDSDLIDAVAYGTDEDSHEIQRRALHFSTGVHKKSPPSPNQPPSQQALRRPQRARRKPLQASPPLTREP